VLAVACGSAAAASSAIWLVRVHAGLAPVAGHAAGGRFDGSIAMGNAGAMPNGPAASSQRLNWSLALPAMRGQITASLRIHRLNNAAPATLVLCSHCATTAKGSLTLTGSQAMRITQRHAYVVVRTASARLRGTVEIVLPLPTA
jgi:hypothetical protein